MNQLNLFQEVDPQKALILKHSEKYLNEVPEKPKKLLIADSRKVNPERFWGIVEEVRTKLYANVNQSRMSYIADNLHDWDYYRLESELIIANAPDQLKNFYLNIIYPWVRKDRKNYEKFMLGIERE